MTPRRDVPVILMTVLVLDILAAVWSWGNWQIWTTATVLALVVEIVLTKIREARARRRFAESMEALLKNLEKGNVSFIRPPDDTA